MKTEKIINAEINGSEVKSAQAKAETLNTAQPKTAKLMCVYHNPSVAPVADDVFVPLRAGALCQDEVLPDGAFWDGDGDNISAENAAFNEMSVVYWAWKNYDKLDNPDFIGLTHYRRFFVFEESKYAYFEQPDMPQNIRESIKFPAFGVESYFENYDFVAPMPNKRRSVETHFCATHDRDDLNLAMEIIQRLFPDDVQFAHDYIKGQAAFYYNMFIFPKEMFFDYCEWIFAILFEFRKLCKHPQERMFVSELLTGIFITKMIAHRKRALLLPVLFIAGKKPSFPQVVSTVKKNLKDGAKFLFAFKPLIFWFVPKGLVMRRRRKSALLSE